MEHPEQPTSIPLAETPPIEVEVLQIGLAAAEHAGGDSGEGDGEGAVAPRDALAALTEAHAAQRQQDADRYRQALLRTAPEVPPELVTGATVEEVDASLATALATVDAVRRHRAQQAAGARVPAGSPQRGDADSSMLSPRQKIALALVGGRSA